MAVANTKSNIIANADNPTATLSQAHLAGSSVRHPVAKVEVLAADDNGSVYRMFRVHSSERINSLSLLNDAITAGTSFDAGLHDTEANGGAVVQKDLFATAVDLSSARVAPLDITFEALNIDKAELMIWELLGLAADPNKYYDLTLTANTVGTADGTIVTRASIVSARA